MTFKDLVEIVDRIEKSVIAAEFKEDYTYEQIKSGSGPIILHGTSFKNLKTNISIRI